MVHIITTKLFMVVVLNEIYHSGIIILQSLVVELTKNVGIFVVKRREFYVI